MSSLRPSWKQAAAKDGGGFSPPSNHFAVLDEDEDAAIQQAAAAAAPASRSAPGRGRSLADLANESSAPRFKKAAAVAADDKNVLRYTREKLLSLRRALPDVPLHPPDCDIVLVDKVQDPVCWDDLDAEGIWATSSSFRARSNSLSGDPNGAAGTNASGQPMRRQSSTARGGSGGAGGRWQRGVALPPKTTTTTSSQQQSSSSSYKDTPLWDDPTATAAAADFSAFGAALDDIMDDNGDTNKNNDSNKPFDLETMAAQSLQFEKEHHHRRSVMEGGNDNDKIRPLARFGTTVQSGSGDDVNVFEDDDDDENDGGGLTPALGSIPAADPSTVENEEDKAVVSSAFVPTFIVSSIKTCNPTRPCANTWWTRPTWTNCGRHSRKLPRCMRRKTTT